MTAERYTRTAVVLHWLIAAAILGQIAFGWYLQTVPRKTPDRTIYVNIHKSTGMLVGLLIAARLAWRLRHRPPPLPASMPPWERRQFGVNDRSVYAFFNGLHVVTSYVFVTLIALHIAAAIKHALFPHHAILRRMLPL